MPPTAQSKQEQKHGPTMPPPIPANERKAEHTPTPWYNGTGPHGITGPNTPNTAGVTVGEAIAHRAWMNMPATAKKPMEAGYHIPISVAGQDTVAIAVGENAKANAALIVEAVNSYASLRQSNEEMRRALERFVLRIETEERHSRLVDKTDIMISARAALARAQALQTDASS